MKQSEEGQRGLSGGQKGLVGHGKHELLTNILCCLPDYSAMPTNGWP